MVLTFYNFSEVAKSRLGGEAGSKGSDSLKLEITYNFGYVNKKSNHTDG